MKKVMLGLLVMVLIIAGIVGYVWMQKQMYEDEERVKERLWETCNSSGLALIRYNGSVVKVRYEMQPNFRWEYGQKVWYCLVQIYFLHPIKVNGTLLGGFGVPKEEFESKYLVRYLSNTTEETPATLLESLNGEWVSAGGQALTEWWNTLPEVKASEIQDYINSLWDRMENSQKYYNYSFPSSQWEVPPKPLPNQTVKIHSLKLWYGARLDILAYQNPANPSKIEIVMYGTIENWTDFTRLVSRIITFYGYPRTDNRNPLAMTDYYSFTNYNKTMWLAWKIKLTGEYSMGRMITNTTELRPETVIFLEEPMIVSYLNEEDQVYPIEYAFWQIVGFPAFGLASNLLLPQDLNPVIEGEWVVKVTRDVVLTGVEHPGNSAWQTNIIYPSLIREKGKGVCHDQSLSSALFASFIGFPTGYMYLNTTEVFGSNHAISFVIIPSSVAKRVSGAIPSLLDIDRDGINDSIMVLADTAHLSSDEIMSYRMKEVPILPFSLPDSVYLAENTTVKVIYNGYATGMMLYPSALPKVLVPPWWNWVRELYPHVNYTIQIDPWKWLNREILQEDSLVFPNGTVRRIQVNITTCINPEQVYNILIATSPSLDYGYEGWAVHVPPSVITEGYVLVFKRLLPTPENIALQPPITPANMGNPPTLKETVPELEQWVLAKVRVDDSGNIQILQEQVVNCNR